MKKNAQSNKLTKKQRINANISAIVWYIKLFVQSFPIRASLTTFTLYYSHRLIIN